MKPRTVYVEKIHSTDNRLKRHIRHDSKSKEFEFDTTGLTITDVVHNRNIPILDQGNIGSCTGNAGIGILGTDPFQPNETTPYVLDEAGAQKLYSDAEIFDGDGPFPPNDNGSSGVSIAQALKNNGVIPAYQHTFSLENALKALTQHPIMIGSYWTEDMFTPDSDGRLHPTGAIAGGHEYVANQIVMEGEQVWICNSWGESWGINGRAYLTFDDFGKLLAMRGDVIVLIPPSVIVPPPVPLFTTQMEYGNFGLQVMQLQERLSTIVSLDGLPCFRWPSSINQNCNGNFGPNTRIAVERYQDLKNIVHTSEAGYGRVGPKTLASLNEK